MLLIYLFQCSHFRPQIFECAKKFCNFAIIEGNQMTLGILCMYGDSIKSALEAARQNQVSLNLGAKQFGVPKATSESHVKRLIIKDLMMARRSWVTISDRGN